MDAAREATAALHAWLRAPTAARAEAYYAYVIARELEHDAANELARAAGLS